MDDQQETNGTGNEISTDDNGVPELLSPVLENQTSPAAQDANQSQTSCREEEEER